MKKLIDYIPRAKRDWIRDFYHDEDGYWLNLKEGYEYTHFGGRVIHEDTIQEILAEFRQYVIKL